MNYFLIYLLLINAAAMLLMHADKQKARRGLWRISEKTFVILAAFGGSIGIILSMYLFRHKTKHVKFFIGIPAILIIQIFILIFLWIKSGQPLG